MARKDNPMLVRCDDLDQLVSRMSTRFTLGTHDCCALLQCSRDWFTANVKPRVRYVYATPRALAAIKRDGALRLSHPDHCWYDAEGLLALIAEHARIERRTKRVSLEAFLADEGGYRRRLDEGRATDLDIRGLNGADRAKAQARQREALEACLGGTGRALLDEAVDLAAKRGRFAYVQAEETERDAALAALRRGGWRTVPDMMDYGDAAETHYRRLFTEGALRCTVAIPQAGGTATNHVMWCRDPFPVAAPGGFADVSDRWVTVPADCWYRVSRSLC